jgi:hypothetical protein
MRPDGREAQLLVARARLNAANASPLRYRQFVPFAVGSENFTEKVHEVDASW